jgi:hypothetical protein
MLVIDIPSFPLAINPPSLEIAIYMISCVALGIIGCLGSLLFFYLSRASGTDDPQNLLSKCLLCTHNALNCIFFINCYLARDLQWTLGQEGCMAMYVGVVMVCLVSLGIICVMALERWLTICYSRSLTRKEVWQLFLFICVLSIIITLIPFFTSTYLEGIQLVDAAYYCVYAWYSRNASIVGSCFCLAFAFLCITLNAFFYIQIWIKFHNTAKRARVLQRREHKVLIRCVSLTGNLCFVMIVTFLVGWTPQMIVAASEILRGVPNTSKELLRLAVVFVQLHNALDPMLIIYFDNKLKREFLDLLPCLNIRIQTPLVLSPVKLERNENTTGIESEIPTLKLDRNWHSDRVPSPPTGPQSVPSGSSVIGSKLEHGSHANKFHIK